MRTTTLSILLCFLAMPLQAQQDNARLSANLMQWLSVQGNEKQAVSDARLQQRPPIVNLLIKVNSQVDEARFNGLGAIVGTKAGNIWTIRIPATAVKSFTELHGIEYFELAPTVRMQMDSARYYANVDSAAKGIGIPMPLSGKGVVIGVLDGGFDFTNPAFYDTTYSTLRISRAWVQDLSGTPPTGYTYGAEFKDSFSLLQKQYDMENFGSHGNACAAIAAGSGIGSKSASAGRGIAYESELVFVTVPTTYLDWREMNMATIIDGINYVFSYAASQGKPAVINGSMGSVLGARDGGSLFAQACDNLSGPGRIIAFGAGNNRADNCHIGKTFSATDTILRTLVPINEVDSGEHRNYIDVWGDSLHTFCLRFGRYKNGVVLDSSVVYCMNNATKQFFLVGSDNDTCFITLTTKSEDYNTRPHATIDIFSTSEDTLAVSVYATGGAVHMWQEYFDESWVTYWGEFVGNGNWATAGDGDLTIGEMGCVKSVITVGASVSRAFWKNLQNQTLYAPPNTQRGKLASYSSRGPTLDNRVKPDIVAPGGMIIAAQNSFDATAVPGGGLSPLLISKYTSSKNGRDYYDAIGQGTSLATPVVSGVVALMLQVNPQLTPDEVKRIFSRTATKDNFTTSAPDASLWGVGKLNAYAAIKETIVTSSTAEVPSSELSISVFPNPSQGQFTIDYVSDRDGFFWVEVTNVLGQTVTEHTWQVTSGKNTLPIDISSESRGLHFVTITGRGGQVTKKVVVD